MSINLVSVTSSRPIEWIRQAAIRINQGLSWINHRNTRIEVTGNYTVESSDYYLAVLGGYTVTLSGPEKARQIIIKDEAGSAGTSPITITGTIDGSSQSINTNYGVLHLISDGTNWFTI